MNAPQTTKPRFRGWFHVIGLVALLACSPILWSAAESGADIGWALAFVIGVSIMMLASALYHRFTWSPRLHRIWKRIDHSTIFAAISGSYIAIAGLTMHGTIRLILLGIVVFGAVGGIILRQVMLYGPKWAVAIPYVVVGWSAVFFLPQIYRGGGIAVLLFVLGGGIAYTVGAVFFSAKRPKLWPATFGYHELFHAFTLLGAGLHFTAIAVALR